MGKTVYYWPDKNHYVIDFYVEIIRKGLAELGYDVVEITPADLKKLKKTDVFLVLLPYKHLYLYMRGFKNVIVWYQGVWPEESFLRNKSKFRDFFLCQMEKMSVKKAKACIFVSTALKEHFVKKYNLDYFKINKKSYIMPCYNCDFVESAFEDQSRYDNNVFCYVGSMAPWQFFKETATFYKNIEDGYGDKVSLKVFTPQQEEARQILEEVGVKRYWVGFSKQEELTENLKDCKYGFILRADNPVNNVATPTKLSTYLSNGLIPIVSDCIRDYDMNMKGRANFIVLDKDLSIEPVRRYIEQPVSRELVKSAFEEYYNDFYNTKKHIENLAELFKAIL